MSRKFVTRRLVTKPDQNAESENRQPRAALLRQSSDSETEIHAQLPMFLQPQSMPLLEARCFVKVEMVEQQIDQTSDYSVVEDLFLDSAPATVPADISPPADSISSATTQSIEPAAPEDIPQVAETEQAAEPEAAQTEEGETPNDLLAQPTAEATQAEATQAQAEQAQDEQTRTSETQAAQIAAPEAESEAAAGPAVETAPPDIAPDTTDRAAADVALPVEAMPAEDAAPADAEVEAEAEDESTDPESQPADESAAGDEAAAAAEAESKDTESPDAEAEVEAENNPDQSMAQFRAQVSRRAGAVLAPGVSSDSSVSSIQGGGRQAVDRVHVVRQGIPASAQQQVPELPQGMPPVPEATTDNPVPHATWLVEQASDKRLPDQTPPALQSSPRRNMPRLGQRPFSRQTLEQVRASFTEGPPVSDPNDQARAQLLSLREGLLQTQDVAPQAGPPVAMQQAAPPQPQPLSAQSRTQAVEVFASLLADVPGTARNMMSDVRQSVMGGQPPRGMESLGDTDLLPSLQETLNEQLNSIASQAGVAGQDLDNAIARRREQLALQTQDASVAINQCTLGQNQSVAAAGDQLSSSVATEHTRIGAQADSILARLGGGNPEDPINIKRNTLISNVNRTVGRQTARYRQARETRDGELNARETEYVNAYDAVTQRDVFQLQEAPPADQTPEQISVMVRASEDWGRDHRDEVRRIFGEFRAAVQTSAESFQNRINEAGEEAIEEIRVWASSRTGETRGFFTWIFEQYTDWSNQARANADAWEELKNQETAALVGDQLDLIARLQDAEAHGISQQQILEANRLDADQQAIVRAYFQRDRSRPFDPISIVAAGVRNRVLSTRRPQMEERLKSLVIERATIDQLETIGNHRGPTNPGRIRERGNAINQALHGGIFGSNEVERAMEQLGGLNEFHVLALKKYYQSQFSMSLDDDLHSELYRGEADRADALLSGRQEEALAAQLFSATQEQFLGTSLGTDEAAIFRALRGMTAEQRDTVERLYRERYHRNLRDDVHSDLGDWTTGTTHDVDRADALLDLNVARADAIALDQALYFGGSSRREDAEGVYRQIAQDVQQEAQRNGWTTSQMEAELSRRTREVTREYDERYRDQQVVIPGADGNYQLIRRGSLQEGMQRMTSGGERDLLVSLSQANQAAADAARIRIEREGVFYASDSVINNTIESQYTRAMEDTRRDLENARRVLQDPSAAPRDRNQRVSPEVMALARQREDLQNNLRERAAAARPPWDENTYYREQQLVEQQIDRETTRLARQRADGYMGAMTDRYQEQYHETVEQVVRENVQNQILGFGGDTKDEALSRLHQGGYLTPYQQFDFAERAGNGEHVLHSIQDLPPDELQRVRERWELEHPRRSFNNAALYAASGEHSVDVQVALRGRPQTLDELVAQESLRVQLQRDSGLLTGLVAEPERETMEHRLEQLREQRERLRDPALRNDPDRMLAAIGEARASAEVVQQATQAHREAVAAVTESIANAASIAVAVVIGAVGAIFTGGASAAVALAIIASLAATATSMGTRALFMGRAYGREQVYTDLAVGVVDAVVAALTAGMGNRMLGKFTADVVERQVERQAMGRMRDFMVRQMARMGETGGIARSVHAVEFLERMAAQEAKWYSRLAAHAITQTVENVVQAVPSALVGSALDKHNWEHGNPLLNILSTSGEQVAHGVVMGMAMSGAHSAAGHIWGFVRGPRLGTGTHLLPPEHLTGKPREAHLREYLEMHPGRTEADFNVEIAREHMRALEDFQQAQAYRENVRTELTDSLRSGGHPDVSDVPVTVLGPVEFERLRMSVTGDVRIASNGQAALVVRDGQVHLVMRAGADAASVRELAGHIAERAQPGTGGRTINPAEALPRDLRNRVHIEVNEKLEGGTVEVHYVEHEGLVVGVWIEAGPNARAIDIQMHADTARSMRSLQGASGKVQQLLDRIGTWFGRAVPPAPGSPAFEARLEVEKLPRVIQERAAALRRAGGINTPEGLRIALEIEHLHEQLAHFERHVNSIEAEGGRGFVAAEKIKPPGEEGTVEPRPDSETPVSRPDEEVVAEHVKPDETTTTHVAPEEPTVTHVAPEETTVAPVKPDETTAPQVQPQPATQPKQAPVTAKEIQSQGELVKGLRGQLADQILHLEYLRNKQFEAIAAAEKIKGRITKALAETPPRAPYYKDVPALELWEVRIQEYSMSIEAQMKDIRAHSQAVHEAQIALNDLHNRRASETRDWPTTKQEAGGDYQKGHPFEPFEEALQRPIERGDGTTSTLSADDAAMLRRWGDSIEALCEGLDATAQRAMIDRLLRGLGTDYTRPQYDALRYRIREEIIGRVLSLPPEKQLAKLSAFIKAQPDSGSMGSLFSHYRARYLEANARLGVAPIKDRIKSLNDDNNVLEGRDRDADGAVNLTKTFADGPQKTGEYMVDDKSGKRPFDEAQARDYSTLLSTGGKLSAGNHHYNGLIYFFQNVAEAGRAKAFLDTNKLNENIHVAFFEKGELVFIR